MILDTKSKVPIYKQIYKIIEERIAMGALLPDEKLPSTRSLAVDLTINPNTVIKAYNTLEADGLIYSMPAKGYFVSSGNDTALDRILSKERTDLADQMTKAKRLGLTRSESQAILDQIYGEDTND